MDRTFVVNAETEGQWPPFMASAMTVDQIADMWPGIGLLLQQIGALPPELGGSVIDLKLKVDKETICVRSNTDQAVAIGAGTRYGRHNEQNRPR